MNYEINIKGRVQGVFFRYHTKKKADQLGLKGWVKNLQDGTVSIFVQGEKTKIEEFMEWCHLGSPAAKVEEVVAKQQGRINKNYADFSIIR